MRRFARSKPWQGTHQQRARKFARLNRALAEAYGIDTPRLTIYSDRAGRDCYIPALHTICLGSRMSVVTYLHEFAHARGMDERQACRWSINLFRRCFPRSFARCDTRGHMLVAGGAR